MLSGQGTSRGGAFGQRWSLPGAPRTADFIGNAKRFLPYFLKFGMNSILLRRTAGMRPDADSVRRKDFIRLPYRVNTR